MDVLICYEVGINSGSGHSSGSCFMTIDRLTRQNLLEAQTTLRDMFITANPAITSVQNLIFRSVTRLDDE